MLSPRVFDLPSVTRAQSLLVFTTSAVWNGAHGHSYSAPRFGSSAVILVIDVGSLVWGKDTTEVRCPSPHSVSVGTMPMWSAQLICTLTFVEGGVCQELRIS